jgi:predicted RNA-binding protein YlqC (UPF0109 family)
MKELVAYLAKVLVDDTAAIEVHEINEGNSLRYELSVAQADIGKVIGREGRTIKALRTLVAAVAQKNGQRAELEILDGRDQDRGNRRERRGPPR